MNAIQAQPGITKVELQGATELASGTIAHHLRVLRRHQRIEIVRVGRCLHVAAVNFNHRMDGQDLLAVPIARRIVAALASAQYPTGPAAIGRHVGTTARRVQGQLDHLVKAGLLESEPGYHPRYQLTPRGQQSAGNLPPGPSE